MSDQINYVVKVNGVAVTAPTSKAIAEQHKAALPGDSQKLAEVVPVTSDGKEVLFG